MRSYGQYCSIARALDVVGDRWTLLIARELLLQGACRFTDLKNGLPGIATNLLSVRLRELEAAGLVTREDAPPPVATVLYELSETGRALEPTLRALGLWGLSFMADERPDDQFQARWLAYAPAWFSADADPGAGPAVIQLAASGELAVIELGDGEVRARPGRAADPDLVLDGPPRAVLGLLCGLIDLDRATQLGLSATGRRDLLARLRPVTRQADPDLPEERKSGRPGRRHRPCPGRVLPTARCPVSCAGPRRLQRGRTEPASSLPGPGEQAQAVRFSSLRQRPGAGCGREGSGRQPPGEVPRRPRPGLAG